MKLGEARTIPQNEIEVPLELSAGVGGGDLTLSYDAATYGEAQVKGSGGILIATNAVKSGEVRVSVARMDATEPVVVWIALTPARGSHPASLSLGTPLPYTGEGTAVKTSPSPVLRERGPGGEGLSLILRLTGQAFGADGWPVGAVESVLDRPLASSLSVAYPNPFNPSTTLRYNLAEDGEVRLTIYNTSGQVVRKLVSIWHAAGRYSVVWDGKDDTGRAVASGLYISRLDAGTFHQAQKMMLLK